MIRATRCRWPPRLSCPRCCSWRHWQLIYVRTRCNHPVRISIQPFVIQEPCCALQFSRTSPQLNMRLMLIVSLLEECVEGAALYHAAVYSELRSLEAIAAACDSMALLLVIQAVRNYNACA